MGSPWTALWESDPVPWLLASDEPGARWLTLTAVLGRPPDDPEVQRAHADVLADPGTRTLLDRLPDWEAGGSFGGHDSPRFAPNLLGLLADTGLAGGDAAEVELLLDRMLAHQEDTGRFASFATGPGWNTPVWGSLLCDTHAVTDALVRFGRLSDPRVGRALQQMAADVTDTAQGRAWPCIPHSATGWRGPGRRGDFCPMVTLQALRTFGRLPLEDRPPGVLDSARVALRAWRERTREKPYMFGHGTRFKTAKWPVTWYSAITVLDAVAGHEDLWRTAEPTDPDRRTLAELLACVLEYDLSADGRATPRSTYRGFDGFSWGQKKSPSPFATAKVLATLAPFGDLAAEAAAVDVAALAGPTGRGAALRPAAAGTG